MQDFIFEIYNEENRQHIGLSKEAFLTILSDMNSFNFDSNRKNKSGFLNIILRNYYEDVPFASQRLTGIIDESLNELWSLKRNEKISNKEKDEIIKFLKESIMKKTLLTYKKKYPIDEYFKLKLNKNNANLITEIGDAKYFEDYGLSFYLKLVFEEYAKLPYVKREIVFFKEQINEFNQAIITNRKILMTYSDKTKEETKPYKIINPHNSIYSVFVLINKDPILETIWLEEVNVNRIKHIKIQKSKPTNLSKNDKIALKTIEKIEFDKTSKKEIINFRVQFSEAGLKKYNNDQNIRIIGQIKSKNDQINNIYTFLCTESDIMEYLFKYGPTAIILFPESTRLKFKKFYLYAFNKYNNEINT